MSLTSCWGAWSVQVLWAAKECDPWEQNPAAERVGAGSQQEGGGMEGTVWGASFLHLSAPWVCAQAAEGRRKPRQTEISGVAPCPYPPCLTHAAPSLPLCHAGRGNMPSPLSTLQKFNQSAPKMWMQKPQQGHWWIVLLQGQWQGSLRLGANPSLLGEYKGKMLSSAC